MIKLKTFLSFSLLFLVIYILPYSCEEKAKLNFAKRIKSIRIKNSYGLNKHTKNVRIRSLYVLLKNMRR